MRAMSGLRRALGEPLLQFIVMGALLFAGYRLVHPERPAKVDGPSHRADRRRRAATRDRVDGAMASGTDAG